MSMQVCDVTKPLGSVRAMLQAGNRVIFDEGGSFIENKASGVRANIEDRNGVFVFDLWVPRVNEHGGNEQQQQRSGYNGKYWKALEDQEDEVNGNVGFVGLDDLM